MSNPDERVGRINRITRYGANLVLDGETMNSLLTRFEDVHNIPGYDKRFAPTFEAV